MCHVCRHSLLSQPYRLPVVQVRRPWSDWSLDVQYHGLTYTHSVSLWKQERHPACKKFHRTPAISDDSSQDPWRTAVTWSNIWKYRLVKQKSKVVVVVSANYVIIKVAGFYMLIQTVLFSAHLLAWTDLSSDCHNEHCWLWLTMTMDVQLQLQARLVCEQWGISWVDFGELLSVESCL